MPTYSNAPLTSCFQTGSAPCPSQAQLGGTTPTSTSAFYHHPRSFKLSDGGALSELVVAYETYGELNERGDNAILVFHAFSGSQHAAGFNPAVPGLVVHWNEECHTGWWDNFIGPKKALDTERFFVVCANVLGGCYGTTGPSSLKPGKKEERYGGDFPWISALDVVRSQALLLDELKIDRLHALIGASLGGIFALTFALEFPERAKKVIPVATAHQINSTQIAANFAQVESIHLDPHFKRGNYYEGRPPHHGLVLARQIAQMTFVDQDTLMERIGSEVHNPPRFPSYRLSHPVESYLRGNASRFVDRFDANSYLVMLDLWQRTDLRRLFNEGEFSRLFSRCRGQEFLQFGIDSDFCFPLYQQRRLQRVLDEAGVRNGLEVVSSQKGHDSFLLEPERYRLALERVLGDG